MAGIEPLLGYDLRKELRYFARDPGRRKIFQQANQDALKARQDILKAKQQGRDSDPQIQRQVLRAWFGSLIPLRGPDGRVLSVSDRERVLELFVESPEQVFNTSPAILAEDVLTGVRASMGNRRPRLQDGMDLMHAILPLAYCDAFISNDGNVRDGAKRTLKATRRDVVVEARLSEALNKLPL